MEEHTEEQDCFRQCRFKRNWNEASEDKGRTCHGLKNFNERPGASSTAILDE